MENSAVVAEQLPNEDATNRTTIETAIVDEINDNEEYSSDESGNLVEDDSNMQLVAELENYSRDIEPGLHINHELKKMYAKREETLKDIYYKSNPLREFVSSIPGQSILPSNSNSIKASDSVYAKKKVLPRIFSELRVNEADDRERSTEYRELHKKSLRTTLKLNLKALEIEKNPVDSLENSKKIYSEYCRYNLSKPLDTSNVESIFKSDFKRFKTRSTRMKKHYTPTSNLNTTVSTLQLNTTMNDSNNSSDEGSFRVFPGVVRAKNSGGADDLEINARMVKLKDLQEMSKEIKQHKAHMAKTSQNTIYPNCNETSSKDQPKLAKSMSSKILPHNDMCDLLSNSDESENKINFNRHQSIASTEYGAGLLPTTSTSIPIQPAPIHISINNIHCFQRGDDPNVQSSQFYSPPYHSYVPDADSKHKVRVQHARDKILHERKIKANLNKMTILQPFEDTKILINIDNVSSKILNNLLNKQKTSPRYHMPPIRSYGYFKKVTTNVIDDGLERSLTGSAKRPSARTRAKFNF